MHASDMHAYAIAVPSVLEHSAPPLRIRPTGEREFCPWGEPASIRGPAVQPVFLDQEQAIDHTEVAAASTVCKGNNGVTFPVLHAVTRI